VSPGTHRRVIICAVAFAGLFSIARLLRIVNEEHQINRNGIRKLTPPGAAVATPIRARHDPIRVPGIFALVEKAAWPVFTQLWTVFVRAATLIDWQYAIMNDCTLYGCRHSCGYLAAGACGQERPGSPSNSGDDSGVADRQRIEHGDVNAVFHGGRGGCAGTVVSTGTDTRQHPAPGTPPAPALTLPALGEPNPASRWGSSDPARAGRRNQRGGVASGPPAAGAKNGTK